jgi:hypothetical protein
VPSKLPADSVPPIEPTPPLAPPVPQPYPPAPPGYGGRPGQPYVAGYYASGYYAPQPRGLAIASMLTGIAGVFFSFAYGFGLLPSIAAIITGHLAQKRQPHARGMWLAGLICGYVGLAISVLWIIAIVVVVAFAVANPAGFETGPVGNY